GLSCRGPGRDQRACARSGPGFLPGRSRPERTSRRRLRAPGRLARARPRGRDPTSHRRAGALLGGRARRADRDQVATFVAVRGAGGDRRASPRSLAGAARRIARAVTPPRSTEPAASASAPRDGLGAPGRVPVPRASLEGGAAAPRRERNRSAELPPARERAVPGLVDGLSRG